MARLPWVQRSFVFEFPVETWPEVVERFRGTSARIEDKVRGLSREVLTASDGGWSIQENVGHLLELEGVFGRRIGDFLAGKALLSAADITNKATHEARYNERAIGDLVRAFREEREAQAATLDRLSDADFARVSEHPRLKQKMRLVDAVTFVCLHDDYHLARMTELARRFGGR
jgi:uncharacterized damage-inducible protein DinB